MKYIFLVLAALAVFCFFAANREEKRRKKYNDLVDQANNLIS